MKAPCQSALSTDTLLKTNSLIHSQLGHLSIGLFALVIALIYLYHGLDFLTFGDSVNHYETIIAGWNPSTGAVTHFLYKNLAHAWYISVPIDSGIKSIHVFVAIWGVLGVLLVHLMAFRLSQSIVLSITVASVWAFSFSHWKTAEIIEVYTMNSCLVVVFLSLLLLDIKDRGRKRLWAILLVLGLLCFVHIQGTLFYPLMLAYVGYTRQDETLLKSLSLALLCLGVCLSPTLGCLWFPEQPLREVFFGGGYQEEVLSLDPMVIVKGFLQSIMYLFYNFWLALIPMAYGFRMLWKHHRRFFWFSLIAAGPTYFFSMRYIVSDNYVFFLPAYLVLLGVFAIGCWYISQRLTKRTQMLVFVMLMIHQPIAYQSSLWIVEQLPVLEEFKKRKAYKGGLRYYLWPGMNNNVDILSLSKQIYLSGKTPDFIADFDWQYSSALNYLRKTEGLPPPPPTEPELLFYENLK